MEQDRFLLHIIDVSEELAAYIFIHHPAAGTAEVKEAYIRQNFYSKTNYMHNFSSLLNITLHVLDSLSVHHQEL